VSLEVTTLPRLVECPLCVQVLANVAQWKAVPGLEVVAERPIEPRRPYPYTPKPSDRQCYGSWGEECMGTVGPHVCYGLGIGHDEPCSCLCGEEREPA